MHYLSETPVDLGSLLNVDEIIDISVAAAGPSGDAFACCSNGYSCNGNCTPGCACPPK